MADTDGPMVVGTTLNTTKATTAAATEARAQPQTGNTRAGLAPICAAIPFHTRGETATSASCRRSFTY